MKNRFGQTLTILATLAVMLVVPCGAPIVSASTADWSEPISLSHSGLSLNLSVAAVDADNVHVAWSDGAGTSATVFHTRWNGASWSSPVMLDAGYVTPRAMAADSLGNVYLVYIASTDEGDTTRSMFYRAFDGTSWSTAVPILGQFDAIGDVSIATDATNALHLVFMNAPYTVYYSKRDGSSWSEPHKWRPT